MRRVSRIVLTLAVAASALGLSAQPASACSCMEITDLEKALAESQAAFVGTLIETRDPHGNDELVSSGRDVVHVFEVEAWIKGDLGELIEVHTPADGASCGFEFWYEDDRIGAFLWEEGGVLHSGLCSQVDPDMLLKLIHSRRFGVGSGTTTPPIQQADIMPIAVETPATTTTVPGSPGVEAAEEGPAETSSLWWVLGVVGLAGAAFAYARATRSSNSSSK